MSRKRGVQKKRKKTEDILHSGRGGLQKGPKKGRIWEKGSPERE